MGQGAAALALWETSFTDNEEAMRRRYILCFSLDRSGAEFQKSGITQRLRAVQWNSANLRPAKR